MAIYAAQLITGLLPETAAGAANQAATFVYVMFGVGIARSWQLLGLKGAEPIRGDRQRDEEQADERPGHGRGTTEKGVIRGHRSQPAGRGGPGATRPGHGRPGGGRDFALM